MRTLVDSFGSPFFQRALVEVIVVGVLTGVVGVHVLLRRLPFFVVAMSHATFPGIVVASVVGWSIWVGGVAAGLVCVVGLVAIGALHRVDGTAAIGVVLAGAFAAGVLVLSAQPNGSRDLSSFLVGSVLTVTRSEIIGTALVGVAVLGVLTALDKELVASAFDPVASAALGYRTGALDAVVLVLVTVTLVSSVPAVGTLLAVAMLTVPALVARQWTDRIGPMRVVAAVVGAASGVVGLCVSAVWQVAAGGAIALVATVFFGLSAAVSGSLRSARRDRSGARAPRTPHRRPRRGSPPPMPARAAG
jgi:manganese/iron transport system permease protein